MPKILAISTAAAAAVVAVVAGLVVVPAVVHRMTTRTVADLEAAPTDGPVLANGATADAADGDRENASVVGRAVQRDPRAAVDVAMAAFAAGVDARFAVAVVDNRTGLSYAYNPDEAFRTASVVKVDILAALVLKAEDEGRTVTPDEWGVATSMIRSSDNDAASELWWEIGGADGLAAYDARLGLVETVPGGGGYWGSTTTTVADRIRLLTVVADPDGPLSAYREDILGLMESVVADQTWGVSAAAVDGEVVALKNGWVEDDDGTWMINSIGRLTGTDTDLSIVVLSEGEAGYSAGIAVVQQLAELARTQLGW